MNFNLTTEQQMLKNMVIDFTQREVSPLDAQIDKTEIFPYQTVSKMAKYNLLGIPIPTKYGGTGGDNLAYFRIWNRGAKTKVSHTPCKG